MVASPALMRSGDTSLQLHVEAGERADMGDAGAHLARADDADLRILRSAIRPSDDGTIWALAYQLSRPAKQRALRLHQR